MKTLIKYIGLTLLMMGTAFAGFAQDELPAVIKKDMTLSGGEYLVTHTTILEGATLTIDNETVLIFDHDAFMQVRGGLVLKGEDNAFIVVKSKDPDNQGIGFVFSGNSNTRINIDHVRFSMIRKPIEFEKNWLRDEVYISNNVFKNLNKNKVPIEIRAADQILINKELKVKIKSNTFSNNYSSILLTETSSPNIKYEIDNNVITQNMYFGADQNGIFTSPMFINYNRDPQASPPSFINNSFVFNYTSHLDNKEVEFYQPFLYAIGSGERIDMSSNYIGNLTDAEIDETLKDIQAEYDAPVIDYKGRPEKPDEKLNGHIYLVSVNDDLTPTSPFTVKVDDQLVRLTLTANRPIQASKYYSVQYRYMLDDTINVIELNHKLSYTNVYKNVIIDIDDRALKLHPGGFIVVDGFYDINGYDVPAVTVGMFQFLKENRDYIMYFENLAQVPTKYLLQLDPNIMENVEIDSAKIVQAQEDDQKDEEVPYPYKWDAGVFVGSTIYFGDLASTGIQFYVPNARPNVGFRLGYRPTQNFRIELAQNTMVITGADDRTSKVGKSRGTNYERGLSFRTTVVDLGLNLEWQMMRFKKMSSIVPSIMVGVNGFYYKPQAQYNNIWYDLRQMGTEGQTQPGGKGYSAYSYGIPMTLKLSKHIKQRHIISISYTHNKLFTDYLDDVSTGEFQTKEALDDVNPETGPIAFYVSNPNDLTGPRSYSSAFDAFAYYGITWLYRF